MEVGFVYILKAIFGHIEKFKICIWFVVVIEKYGILMMQYAISQLLIVRSGLHLVTYLDMGNFCDKSTETTLPEICVQVFLRFSDSSKPGQSVSFIYKLACWNW